MKKKAGHSWGTGRAKFAPAVVSKALQMRLEGKPLAIVSKATGMDPSYISRLVQWAETGKGRSTAAKDSVVLQILRVRERKLAKRLADVRQSIRNLEGNGGKSADAAAGKTGPAKTGRAHPAPRRAVRAVPKDAGKPNPVADRSQAGEDLGSESSQSSGANS